MNMNTETNENNVRTEARRTARPRKQRYTLAPNLERLVLMIARRYEHKSPGYSLDDLVQVGRIGAWTAQMQFGPGCTYTLEKLVVLHVKREILGQVRRNSNLVHVPMISKRELEAEGTKAPEDQRVLRVDCSEWQPEYEGLSTEDGYAAVEARMILDSLMTQLPESQQPFASLMWDQGLSVKDAGDELGITHENARYLRRESSRKVRKICDAVGLTAGDFLS